MLRFFYKNSQKRITKAHYKFPRSLNWPRYKSSFVFLFQLNKIFTLYSPRGEQKSLLFLLTIFAFISNLFIERAGLYKKIRYNCEQSYSYSYKVIRLHSLLRSLFISGFLVRPSIKQIAPG